MVFVDGVHKFVHAYFLNVEKVAEVVDAYLSVAAVRESAREPCIVVDVEIGRSVEGGEDGR